MLGSVTDAEDVVQEALLRLHREREAGQRIEAPRAFVATVTTRLAIDELRSARARREQYVGEWLPEPVLTDGVDDPARHAEMADSLSMAMLVLLESLSPEQRAVLLLRDVFDYSFEEIAEVVGKSVDNVRQLAVRARRHVEERRPRFKSSREERDELTRRFFAAFQDGDVGGLEALLAHDVVLTGDGGGKVPALARSLHGRSRVARTLVNWSKLRKRVPGASLRVVEVNGSPGALIFDGEERLVGVWALEIAGGQIQGVRSIVNPEKLAHLGPVSDVMSQLGSAQRPDLMSAERPDLISPERPDLISPERPDLISPERPDLISPERPDLKSPERPDLKSPERPDLKSPERPDLKSPERPDLESPERPDLKSAERPDLKSPKRPAN
jgi:RNA polymerase sigma-70 factor (TIGR02957 family)